MKFVMKSAIAGFAVWLVTLLTLDIEVTGGQEGDWWSRPLVFLGVGALLVLLNGIVRPVLNVLSIPFQILTLGLFSAVIAWFMLQLTEWITGAINIFTFDIGGFWKTLLAAIVIAIVTSILERIVPGAKKRKPKRD